MTENNKNTEKQCDIHVVSISSLAELAKEEEELNRENMIKNYNAPLDKIQPYENKHFQTGIVELP